MDVTERKCINNWIQYEILQIKKDVMEKLPESTAKKSILANCNTAIEYLNSINNETYNEDQETEISNLNEYIDNLTEQDKDLCGELELYRNENCKLKKEITEKNSTIVELEKDNECLRKLNDIICLESKMYQDQVNSLTALKEMYEYLLKEKK